MAILNAGYITPPLQAVLDTLSPGNKTWVSVHLKESPNLARFPQRAYAEKIAYLREFSQRTQQPLIDFANSFGNQIDSLKSFWVYNGFCLKATKPVILAIASKPQVEFLNGGASGFVEEPSGSAPPPRQIEWNIKKVRAHDVWSMGYTGQGIVVCIFDSGMRENHEAWWSNENDNKWRRIFPYPDYTYAWFDTLYNSRRPHDPNGHGTHVGGIAIGGDGGSTMPGIGVAYGAKLIACIGGTDGGNAVAHACFQWIAELTNTPYGNLAPDVVNCSWGNCYDWEDAEFWDDVALLRSFGIIPVFCIGNSGLWNRSWPPGNFPHTIGIGATDSNNVYASFSCPGPSPETFPWNNPIYWSRTDWNFIKPDIMAPGTDVNNPSQGDGIRSADKNSNQGYIKMWGTSQATPHVTGAIALMLEASRDVFHYDLNYYDIYNILLETANRRYPPNNYYGWGRLDCYEAVNGVLNYHLKSSSPMATGPNNADRIGYGNDLWHLVYESGGPMAKYVRYAVSTDNGATWSFEANGANGERIGKIGDGSSPALSVLPNGDAHVVWLDGSYLLYSKKLVSSSVWTEPVMLCCEESYQETPSFVVDPVTNIGHVVFVNISYWGKKIIYGWFDTQAPELDYFVVDQGEVSNPSIGIGTDGPHLAWCKSIGLMRAIYYTCAPDWMIEQISGSVKNGIFAPDLVVSQYDGTVAVVWEEKNGNSFDIRCRRKASGVWQSLEWVCQTAEESRHPVITANPVQNHYYVAWADSMTADYDWEIYVSADYSLGWETPQNISGWTADGSKNPQLAYCPPMMIEGTLLTLYTEGSSNTPSNTSRYVPVYEIRTASAGYPFGGGPQSRKAQPIKHFFFHNIYPNPAKGRFNIKFNSPDERKVSVKVYDVTGRLVKSIYDGKSKAGMNEFSIRQGELSAGIYFTSVETDNYRKTQKVILVR